MAPSNIFLCVAILAAPVAANTFLASAPLGPVHPPLLEELESVIGSSRRAAVESRVLRLEEALRPTFQSMPKDQDGGLLPDGVRYALHRIFVDRHGWFVQGLDSAGGAWGSSSPAAIFEEAHDGVRDLFERRLGNHSFTLHHTAVLAATLESFVHAETIERLHAAYRVNLLSRDEDSATEEQVANVLETYMVFYVLGANYSSVTQESTADMMQNIEQIYPTWQDTRSWAREVWQEVIRADSGSATSFDATVRAVEAIGDRYGRWQDTECRDLKTSLLRLEEPGTGRVRLDKFYQSALEGNWQFSESRAYLRQLGALDEADPQRPSVIIANYVNSPSNCVASSSFYSVCCIDECESLKGHLETHIAAPDSSPARIVELVEDLSSSTTEAPRSLPAPLVKRLEKIVVQQGGVVPLHGRLFAQWMHHAYPRECTYPHLSGTTNPLTPEMWTKQTGEDSCSDAETMRWHVEEAKQGFRARHATDSADTDLPWSAEEELFVIHPEVHDVDSMKKPRAVRKGLALMACAAIVSMTVMLLVRLLPVLDGAMDPSMVKSHSKQTRHHV